MKKLLLVLFGLICLSSVSLAVPLGQGLGDYFPAGIKNGNVTYKVDTYVHQVTAEEITATTFTQTVTSVAALGYMRSLSVDIYDDNTARYYGEGLTGSSSYIVNAFMDDLTHVYVNFGTALQVNDLIIIKIIRSTG